MRLIDKDELIKSLGIPEDMECCHCEWAYTYGGCIRMALSDVCFSIENAEEVERWIPCSERLPEKYGWYQVTLKDGRVSRLYYDYKGDRWIDNVRKHMFELYDIYSKITHKRITEEKEDVYWDDWVVAWMPLPEAYGGGEDE